MKKKRTNMKPAERRNQILDCAEGLFFSKGYDITTLSDILKAAGVSKGGFYHHFTSKEELIGCILSRHFEAAEVQYLPAIEAEGLTALERYLFYFEILRGQQTPAMVAIMMQLISALLREENALLQARFSEILIAAVVPVFTQVLQLGIDEGIFDIDDANTAAALIVRMANHHQYALKRAYDATNEDELEAARLEISATLRLQSIAIDRLLGLPDGTTLLRSPDFVDNFISFVRAGKISDDPSSWEIE